MGIAKTLSNYKSFTFAGTNSRNYGVYITGEGVFNAPERNVEMVEIPGRNGAFALDKGNFNNIEITYPAGIFADTESDFADAVSDLRNFLCSKNGYVRLEDDYNTGEYRLAIYKSGLEVSHDMLIAGEFDITFECKPQRYLTSGETAVAVTSGGKVTNPTLFPSHPMLEAAGYGTINIGLDEIVVNNAPIGTIILHENKSWKGTSKTITIDDTYANIGDAISCNVASNYVAVNVNDIFSSGAVSFSGDVTDAATMDRVGNTTYLYVGIENPAFAYGTPLTYSGSASFLIITNNHGTKTVVFNLSFSYNGTDTFTVSFTSTVPSPMSLIQDATLPSVAIGTITLNSTQYSVGNPLYIDLDIGEAYKIENGSAVSVNNAVSMPAELPTLPSGDTTITYDNTFTQVKVVPRWWKV